jgi:hypothetical protein
MTDTELSDLEYLQEFYRDRGFLVIACNYPKDIGEILELEDPTLDGTVFRVSGESTVKEMESELRPTFDREVLNRPYFYRAVAVD